MHSLLLSVYVRDLQLSGSTQQSAESPPQYAVRWRDSWRCGGRAAPDVPCPSSSQAGQSGQRRVSENDVVHTADRGVGILPSWGE